MDVMNKPLMNSSRPFQHQLDKQQGRLGTWVLGSGFAPSYDHMIIIVLIYSLRGIGLSENPKSTAPK